MKTKFIFSKVFLLLVIVGLAGVASASEHQLYTLSGFVDLLIEKGIIPGDKIQKAQEIVASMEQENATAQVQNSENLEVSVSQYIEHASLTYNKFEDINGLLLIVKNTSDTSETFEAKRGCQVVYKIYSDTDELLYDSSTEKKCTTDETVTYVLEADQSRTFEVTHKSSAYALQTGVYRFVLEYPGYGEGEREVTIK